MTGHEPELLEAELRRLKPAQPPEEFLARLVAARPGLPAPRETRWSAFSRCGDWWRLLRWLAPGVAAVAAFVALWAVRVADPTPGRQGPTVAARAKGMLKADDVLIDRHLVATYDAVAQLPGGEPVRFRCREWADGVVWRDTARGVEIEQRTPRLEIVPVRFETY